MDTPLPRAGRARAAARAVPLLLIVALAVAAMVWGVPEALDLDRMQANRAAVLDYRDAHPVLSLVLFLILYVVIAATVPPGGFLMMLVAGFLFGFWAGFALAVIGCTAGAVITFYAGRTALGRRLQDRTGDVRRRLQGNAFAATLFLHIFPLVPYFLINLAAGLAGVPVRKFTLATALGVIPNAFAWVALGDAAGLALDAGEGIDTSLLANPQIYLPLAVLSILSGAVLVMRWRSGARQT